VNVVVTGLDTYDIRFPTSRHRHGSDAMNQDPDYSAAYCIIRTNRPLEGHGFVFTIGRGTEVQVAAIDALAPLVIGRPVDGILAGMGAFSRLLTGDSQLRWLGPDKGVVQMAAAAVINGMWDLYAKRERKPLWKLLSGLSPEQIADLIDFRYLADDLTRDEALEILRRAEPGRAARETELRSRGLPAYTTTPGWLGYTDEKLVRLCQQAVNAGFRQVKLKVGANIDDDIRRCGLARDAIGPDVRLTADANQRWDVPEAIKNISRLRPFDLHWVEEPTHPDDILGYATIAKAVAPITIAAGEHVPNRVVFKQLLSLGAIGICQMDACRVSGVNENIAILLLAAKYGAPVCPHAGGVGLCEVVQHLAMFDFVAVSGHSNDRIIEYVDHLHEHFTDPAVIRDGHYLAPEAPGSGATIRPESLARFAFPDGPVWSSHAPVETTAELAP
jgi:L-fuconate dehydratase